MNPSEMASDWRLTNQQEYLMGITLKLKNFEVNSERPDWDHEHCEFCFTKIVDAKYNTKDEKNLTEAYASEDNYRWICSNCYSDFKEVFQWKLA